MHNIDGFINNKSIIMYIEAVVYINDAIIRLAKTVQMYFCR